MTGLAAETLTVLVLAGAVHAAPLVNLRYRVEALPGPARIRVSRLDQPGVASEFDPRLQVFFSASDPGLRLAALDGGEMTSTAGWSSATAPGNEPDLYRALRPLEAAAQRLRELPGRIEARLGESGTVVVTLPPGKAAPVIEWRWKAAQPGFYSIAFTGLREDHPDSLDFLYQPLVWSWKRFPAGSYVTPEHSAATAAAFRTRAGVTEGLAVTEIPFRIARLETSQFGLMLRSQSGLARPVVLAPLPGGEGSHREAGATLAFRAVYVLCGGGWEEGIRFLLQDVIGYRNERENAAASLNRALENLLAYGMDDALSGWDAGKRGFDYGLHVPGTVLVASALHALGPALLAGDAAVYRRRAVPLIEYVMSREKRLWTDNASIAAGNDSPFLRGPCVELGELAALHDILGRKSPAFLAEARRIYGRPVPDTAAAATWQDALAMHRITGGAGYLERATLWAGETIRAQLESPPRDFEAISALPGSRAASFLDYGPAWFDLLDLYELTAEKRFLDAAAASARQMLLWLRSNPKPPQRPIPAWRTSPVGLSPGQVPAFAGGDPFGCIHHAAWLLRLAQLTRESLFADAAYNAVLGRDTGFSGEDAIPPAIGVGRQAESPPPRPSSIEHTPMSNDRVWPHIASLAGFLVSDACYRSRGEVDFPSVHAPGLAHPVSRVYGHQPGSVYGHKGIFPWLPRAGVGLSSPKVNWLLGVGEYDLWVILMNTARHPVHARVALDPAVAAWKPAGRYPLRAYPGALNAGMLSSGGFSVTLAPQGFSAIRISGLRVNPSFQRRLTLAGELRNGYWRSVSDNPALGTLTAFMLNAVPEYSDFYAYSSATGKDAVAMRLHYEVDGKRETIEDPSYPFEFSLRLAGENRAIRFAFEAIWNDRVIARSEDRVLADR